MSHSDTYQDFIYNQNKTDFLREVTKYLKENSYSRHIGDMVINALSTITSTNAFMYTRELPGQLVQTLYITPMRGKATNGYIQLLISAEHCEPIVHINAIATGAPGTTPLICFSLLKHKYIYFIIMTSLN